MTQAADRRAGDTPPPQAIPPVSGLFDQRSVGVGC